MGEKRGGSGEKVVFVAKVKNCRGKTTISVLVGNSILLVYESQSVDGIIVFAQDDTIFSPLAGFAGWALEHQLNQTKHKYEDDELNG